MTKEKAAKFLPIIKAYIEGATIQYFSPVEREWKDTINPAFASGSTYRIKPEPKLVPFTLEDADKLSGKAVTFKGRESVYTIFHVCSTGVNMSCGYYDFKQLQEYATFFPSGEPCGKY